MTELFGVDWRLALRAVRPGTAARSRISPASSSAGRRDRRWPSCLDTLFHGASDGGRTDAFSEGSWADLSDGNLRDIMSAPLQPHQSLKDIERRILRAQATLVLRRCVIDAGTVGSALSGARILDAARRGERGAVIHLEERLTAELDTNGNDSLVEFLVNTLQAVRMTEGSPQVGLHALVAPPSRGAVTTPPARWFFASGTIPEKEPAVPLAHPVAEVSARRPDLLPGLTAPAQPSRGSEPTEPASMARALDRLADILDRQAQNQEGRPSTITISDVDLALSGRQRFRRRSLHRGVRGDLRHGGQLQGHGTCRDASHARQLP
ncbi:hypothetical protein N9L68_00475 [bacterium]|nr:hypothetical protein [bacterium]